MKEEIPVTESIRSAQPQVAIAAMAADDVNTIVEVDFEVYRSAGGLTARREYGLTPNGNPVGGRFVLRDADGKWIDFDQYRHDLFEHNGLKLASRDATLKGRP